ncbi:hypothetical protein NC651_029415 [Populus alba x Populus x berolinensis]|nr:hypothetical protein NC651_029415 [Populus alba x Populus x berolinensis]
MLLLQNSIITIDNTYDLNFKGRDEHLKLGAKCRFVGDDSPCHKPQGDYGSLRHRSRLVRSSLFRSERLGKIQPCRWEMVLSTINNQERIGILSLSSFNTQLDLKYWQLTPFSVFPYCSFSECEEELGSAAVYAGVKIQDSTGIPYLNQSLSRHL